MFLFFFKGKCQSHSPSGISCLITLAVCTYYLVFCLHILVMLCFTCLILLLVLQVASARSLRNLPHHCKHRNVANDKCPLCSSWRSQSMFCCTAFGDSSLENDQSGMPLLQRRCELTSWCPHRKLCYSRRGLDSIHAPPLRHLLQPMAGTLYRPRAVKWR